MRNFVVTSWCFGKIRDVRQKTNKVVNTRKLINSGKKTNMAAQEEFDISSDEESIDNEWKFDENDDIFKQIDYHAISLGTDMNKNVANAVKNVKTVAEISSNERKVSRMDLNTAKAGMEGLDKEKINQIIHEASKGSRFYENEKKKEKQVQKRIEELQRKMASFSDEMKVKAGQTADKIVQELEQGRDLTRTIVHIDMDAFYAAVEMRDDPSLKSKPMAVGGSAMLCTSNYLARRYGVRAGMPGFIGKKLCPHLTIVRTNFDKYTRISHEIREVLAEYDKNFLPMSLDEAYLDITDYLKGLSVQDKGSSEVSEETSPKIERKYQVENDGWRKGESIDMEDVLVERNEKENAKDTTMVAVKQETSKIEEVDSHDFDQVAKQRKLKDNIDIMKYEPDVRSCEEVDKPNQTEARRLNSDKEYTVTPKHEICSETDETDEKNLPNQGFRGHRLSENDTSRLRENRTSVGQEIFYNKVEEVVNEMRRKIEIKTQLTASAGIAPNMFLAKVCSDKNKPNGQFYLKPDRHKIIDFVHELPLRKAFGIGRVSEQILTSILNVSTCSQLYDRRDLMQLLFTPTACRNYLEIALGLGSTVVDVDRERKSMSTETTFKEINKPEEHFAKCRELCQELSDSLKKAGLTARKVGIKLKTVNFEVKTRVSTTSFPVQEVDDIFSQAKKLIVHEIRSCSPEPLRLRLMGVRAADLSEKGRVSESKQPTIVSLMKKNENVQIAKNVGGRSAKASGLDLGQESVSNADDGRQLDSDSVRLEHKPCPSKQYTIDQLTFDDPGCDNLRDNIKMGKSTPGSPTTFNCPVCGKDLTFTSGNTLLQMNQHVDMCLRKQAMPGALSSGQTSKVKQSTKKRKRESSGNSTSKRKPMDRFLTKHSE